MKFLGKINEHGIHPLIKLKVDEYLMDSKSNFRIKEKLEAENFHDDVISTGKQLSNRRSYLKTMLLGELSRNTESGFYQWLKNHEVNFEEAKDHDLFVVAHKLSKENFVLIVTSKSLLKNVPKENQSGIGFLAVDTTHKLISCQFKFQL